MVIKQSLLNKLLYVLALLIFIASFIFSAYYITTGRETLTRWFFSLNDCIYRKEFWSNEFFTPHTKEMGNRWCLLATAISVVGTLYIVLRWRKSSATSATVKISWPGRAIIWPLVVVILGSSLWTYSFSTSAPAYDEIFTAVHSSSDHPFQALSYYMLPNNHVLFSVLNNIIFHPFDKVTSGRIISLFAYLGILLIAFYWFKGWMRGNLSAFLATLLIAVHFPVLGFSSQARGYELQLFAGWVVFVSLFKYYESRQTSWLRWLCIACIIGYATIPTFLYFHAAILAFSFFQQIYQGNFDLKFWKYQIIASAFIFLFYLPAFSLSGFSSFSDNPTVRASDESLIQFLPVLLAKLQYFISFCFSFLLGEDNLMNYALFLLPVCLCFSKNRLCRIMGLFYIKLWILFILVVLYFKKIPFNRNLVIQYSITQGLVVLTLFKLAKSLAFRLNSKLILRMLFPAVSLLLAAHYLVRFGKDGPHLLYYHDVNKTYQSFEFVTTLPRHGSIAFSDEAFYPYYLCNKASYNAFRCAAGTELYYVKLESESLPSVWASNYNKIQSLPNGFELYRRSQ